MSHTALSLDFWASFHDSVGIEFRKSIIQNSSINIGLYSSKKIRENSTHFVCQVNDNDSLIIDYNTSEGFLTQAKELGVAIDIVDIKEV